MPQYLNRGSVNALVVELQDACLGFVNGHPGSHFNSG
jgi:hypothetical protein